MKRGSLYWINLEPSDPPEFGKIRPGLILSHSEYNLRLSSVVILPISSRAPEIWPLRLAIDMPKMKKKSYLVLPGIRQISKMRLEEFIGIVDVEVLTKIDEALKIYLGTL